MKKIRISSYKLNAKHQAEFKNVVELHISAWGQVTPALRRLVGVYGRNIAAVYYHLAMDRLCELEKHGSPFLPSLGPEKIVEPHEIVVGPYDKMLDHVARAIESSLPYSTIRHSGWDEVTPRRKRACFAGAAAMLAVFDRVPPKRRKRKQKP